MKRWLSVCFAAFCGTILLPQLAAAALGKYVVLENNVGYLRIAKMDKNTLDDIPAALTRLQSTNTITGLVVDLRFAGGNDTDDVPSIEHLLEQPKLPLAILINSQTTGASAKLAEGLREENSGLVFGAAADNFQPDIAVPSNPADEKRFLDNPYAAPPLNLSGSDTSTNLVTLVDIDHTTEADLVREKVKDGDQDDTMAQPAPQKPFIRDPVLARGVDFIKGIAALHLTANQP